MPRHTLVPRERSYRGQSSGNDGGSFVRVGWGFLALGGLAVIVAVPQLLPFVAVPGGIIGAWALREKRTRPAKDIVVDESLRAFTARGAAGGVDGQHVTLSLGVYDAPRPFRQLVTWQVPFVNGTATIEMTVTPEVEEALANARDRAQVRMVMAGYETLVIPWHSRRGLEAPAPVALLADPSRPPGPAGRRGACPRCDADLDLRRCPAGHGQLFDAVETEVVLERAHLSLELVKELATVDGASRIVCAGCGGTARELRLRGVLVDLCVGCGALWCDPGELRRLEGER